MSLVSTCPLRGRVRLRDELRHRLARYAPSRLIQRVQILPDGTARPGESFPVDVVRSGDGALLIGIGGNQAGIDSKGGSVDQPFCHATLDYSLEKLAQQIAIAEATMPVLGEGRVVRHLAV